jgi:uncharacterized membrane protein
MLPPVSAGTAGAVGRSANAASRLRVTRSRARGRVTVLTVAAALVYAVDGLIRLRRFRDGTFDLVIFDQAVRGYAHFRAPASIARGVADGVGTHFLVLADHWSPILALLAPLYWIHDGPATLIVAQAALFALAIPPLWVFTRRLLGPGAAYFVCGAYALSLPVAAAVNFDFHEVAFVPVLTAVMAERCQAGRRMHAVIAAIALLMVKEDMGLLVAGYGAYLFLIRQRKFGLSFMAGGVAATWLSTRVLIPAFGGSASFYWAYGQLGATVPAAAWHVVTHPLQAVRILVTPHVKMSTMVSLVAPLGFLPLASPMIVAAVPLLLERMLATGYPAWWTTDYHYDAFIVMVLVLAAVDGAARIQRLIRVQVRGSRPWLRIWPRARAAAGTEHGTAGTGGRFAGGPAERLAAGGAKAYGTAVDGRAAGGGQADGTSVGGVAADGALAHRATAREAPAREAPAQGALAREALAREALAHDTLRRGADGKSAAARRAGRCAARWVPLASLWAAAIFAAAVVALPQNPLGQLLHPTFYTVNARVRAAVVAASMVPDGALVEATDYVGPHLSGRAQVLLLDGTPRWAPWVVVDTRGLDFPFCAPAQQGALVSYLKAHGYTKVFSRDGFVVLRRPQDARTQAALRHPTKASGLRGNTCARYRQQAGR